MSKIELNAADDIRMISDEDLGAVAGGFVTYNSGGAGGTARGKNGPENTAFHDVLSIGANVMFGLIICIL